MGEKKDTRPVAQGSQQESWLSLYLPPTLEPSELSCLVQLCED